MRIIYKYKATRAGVVATASKDGNIFSRWYPQTKIEKIKKCFQREARAAFKEPRIFTN